jgi:hypothetical protein
MMMQGRWDTGCHLHLKFAQSLLLRHVFALSGHQDLLFLFAAFEVVLFLGCQSSAEAGERTHQGRNNTAGVARREGARLRRRPMRYTDLWNKERLAGVPDSPDELPQRLKIRILNFPHS